MSERWDSSIEPWRPPEGFVNPVPPGRGDQKPGRPAPRAYVAPAPTAAAQPSQTSPPQAAPAPVESADDALEELKRKLKTGIAFIVVAVIAITQFAPVVPDLIDSAKDRVEREIDKQTGAAAPGSGSETLVADGSSNLPGGYASVSYYDSEDMVESWERKDIDNPYDGSTWFLTDPGAGWAMLGYYTFVPPNTTAQDREVFIDQNKAEDEKLAGHAIDARRTRVDGKPAYVYDYRAQGEHRHVIWVLGDVHSYTLRCSARQRSFERQCRAMRRSLSISR